MKALLSLLAAVGVTVLVVWFWRQQIKGQVEDLPPLAAQLERLTLGQTPESLVATLVLSEPFQEADPWDSALKRRSAMAAWFGEPREVWFLEALGREPRVAVWRLDSDSPEARARAEAEVTAAAAWAKRRNVRLRVIAHGAALLPVLRAGLAASGPGAPAFERLLGVGVSLADVKGRDPRLFAALGRGLPAAQWLGLYSDPGVVPRVLMFEAVGPGPEARAEEAAWPGRSWVATVAELSARGAPAKVAAVPAPTGSALMSARQYRNKEGRTFMKPAPGSLTVPMLEKEEIPPDPEAGLKKPGAAAGGGAGELLPMGPTGWSLRRIPVFNGVFGKEVSCVGAHVLFQEATTNVTVQCFKPHASDLGGGLGQQCRDKPQNRVRFTLKGRPAEICKEMAPAREYPGANWSDVFMVRAGDYHIIMSYSYPGLAGRDARLDVFMGAIDALEPPPKK